MKIISFVRKGQTSFGAVVPGGIIDLGGSLSDNVHSLNAALTTGIMDEAMLYIAGCKPEFTWSDVTLLPVIPDPSKILCIGLNYQKHKIETGRPDVDYPTVFTRFPDSQVAHGQPMMKPTFSDRFDYEGEMAVIIGRGGRNITQEDALDHVGGYACYNDGSIRDWQQRTSQFTPGKNFPSSGGFGPYMVTTDEVGDYRQLSIQTRLNGKVMQDASLTDLIFPVEELISYCSQFTYLSPGDVIVSGTPGGVGDRRNPPIYMFAGDTVEVEIGCLGTLRNPVIDEPAA